MQRHGLKGWKLDAGQEGHRIIFKDYQKAIIDIMVEDPLKSWGSGKMHEAVLKQGIKISRASVIFYLNFLVEDGLASFEDATGKGGHHKLYRISKTWDEVRNHIVDKIILALEEGLNLEIVGFEGFRKG